MGVKSRLKQNDVLRRIVKRIKVHREYFADARFMNSKLLDGGRSIEHHAYRVMIRVHSIEKGLSYREPRAFGAAKARDLAALVADAPPGFELTTAYRMGREVLESWLSFNANHDWGDPDVMALVRAALEQAGERPTDDTTAGARLIHDRDPHLWSEIPIDDFVASRHSTRRFRSGTIVSDDVIQESVGLALLSPSACNRQMVRLRVIDDIEKKRLLYDTLHGTGGIDFEWSRIGVITFDAQSLEFYGERNQGYLNAGLFAMTLVYAFHWKGIGSCLLQFGNTFAEERTLSAALGLPSSERIAVGIAFGEMEESDTVPRSVRRRVDEVLSLGVAR